MPDDSVNRFDVSDRPVPEPCDSVGAITVVPPAATDVVDVYRLYVPRESTATKSDARSLLPAVNVMSSQSQHCFVPHGDSVAVVDLLQHGGAVHGERLRRRRPGDVGDGDAQAADRDV